MNRPKIAEVLTDTGEHDHYVLIDSDTDQVLWSENKNIPITPKTYSDNIPLSPFLQSKEFTKFRLIMHISSENISSIIADIKKSGYSVLSDEKTTKCRRELIMEKDNVCIDVIFTNNGWCTILPHSETDRLRLKNYKMELKFKDQHLKPKR